MKTENCYIVSDTYCSKANYYFDAFEHDLRINIRCLINKNITHFILGMNTEIDYFICEELIKLKENVISNLSFEYIMSHKNDSKRRNGRRKNIFEQGLVWCSHVEYIEKEYTNTKCLTSQVEKSVQKAELVYSIHNDRKGNSYASQGRRLALENRKKNVTMDLYQYIKRSDNFQSSNILNNKI